MIVVIEYADLREQIERGVWRIKTAKTRWDGIVFEDRARLPHCDQVAWEASLATTEIIDSILEDVSAVPWWRRLFGV